MGPIVCAVRAVLGAGAVATDVDFCEVDFDANLRISLNILADGCIMLTVIIDINMTLEPDSVNRTAASSLIFDEIEYISNKSQLGMSYEHIRKNYRASKTKSHLIFYRVENNNIEIIRILHQRIDLKKRLEK